MSIPASPKPAPHHEYQSWSTSWYQNGKRKCKRFGRVDEVTKAAAMARYQNWLNGEWKEQQAASARIISEGEPDTGTTAYTVKKLCVSFAEHAKMYYRKNGKLTTQIGQVEAALNALLKEYGPRSADAIGSPEVSSLRDKMIHSMDRHGQPRKLTVSTVNGRLRVIKQAFAWARGKGMVSRLAAVDVSLVKPLSPGRSEAEDSEGVKPVPQAIIDATIKECPKTVADMIRLQLLTGMRPGEACIMRPCDIDSRDKSCWLYSPSRHKMEHKDKVRIVPIGKAAQKILVPYIKARGISDYIFLPEESHRERLEAIGFPAVTSYQMSRSTFKPGRCFRVETYRNKVQYACDRVFDPKGEKRKARDYSHRWTPNQLRHNYATMVRAKFGLEAAADVLGHGDLKTTQIYAERSVERAMEIARKVG